MLRLFENFFNKSLFVLFFIVCVFVVGFFSFNRIGKSADSFYGYNHVRIVTNYGGSSLEKVDLEVTTKIEEELQKIEYVGNISSMSKIGESIIDVELKIKNKKYLSFTLSDLRARLNSIYNESLPKSASLPMLDESINHVYNIVYVLKGKDYNTLYSHLKTKILPIIAGIKGIERHKVWGGKQEILYIVASKNKLHDYGISTDDLKRALNQNHFSFAKEELILKNGKIGIVADSIANAKKEISNIVISTATGGYKLSDIAEIKTGFQMSKNMEFLYNDQNALALGIALSNYADAIKLNNLLDRKMALSLTEGIELEKMNLHSDGILNSYQRYFIAFLVFIIFIAVLILFLFAKGFVFAFLLGSVFTIFAIFIGMNLLSISLNRTTILAIFFVFFLFTAMVLLFMNKLKFSYGGGIASFLPNDNNNEDDGFLTSFKSSLKYSVPAEIIIFLFGLFLNVNMSLFGSILYDFGSVLIIGAIVNFLALTLVIPSLCKMFYSSHQMAIFKPLKLFTFLFKFFLKLRYLVFILFVLLLFILPTLLISSKVSITPLVKHSKYVRVDLTLPLGTKIEKTTSVIKILNDTLQGQKNVVKSFTWIGDFTPRISQSVNIYNPDPSRVFMIFELDRESSVDNFIKVFDGFVSNGFPDVKFSISKISSFVEFDNIIKARIVGEEQTVLRKYAEQVSYSLYSMNNLNNVRTNWRGKVRVILPLYSSKKAEIYDISRQDLIDVLEYYYNGYNIGYYYDKNSTSIPVMLRPSKAGFKNSKVGTRQIYSKKINDFVSIGEIVNALEYRLLNGQTTKYNRKTNIDIMADNSFDNTIYSMLKVKGVVNNISLPEGYFISLEGSFTNYLTMLKEGFEYFVLLAILLLLFVLAMFNNLSYVFSFVVIVPTAVVLDLLLLQILGLSVNVMSMLAFFISLILFFVFAVSVIDNIEKYKVNKTPEEAMFFGIGENVKSIFGFALGVLISSIMLFMNDFNAGFISVFALNSLYFALATLLIFPQTIFFSSKKQVFRTIFRRRR